MASKLEESTQTVKKLAIGCGIFVIIILIATVTMSFIKDEEEQYYPYPRSSEKSFGTLPELEFESIKFENLENLEYKLDTADGKLQTFPPILYVFKTKTPRQAFTASDDAKETAKKLGFIDQPKTPSNTMFKWTKDSQTLKLDRLYWTVSLTTDYKSDDRIIVQNDLLPDIEPYIDTARAHFNKADLFPSGYSGASTQANYMRMTPKFNFLRASSSSEASFIRVDFFKNFEATSVYIPEDASDEKKRELQKLRVFANVLSDNPHKGLLYLIMGGRDGANEVFELKYSNWEIESSSTYPVISTYEAWEEVKNGNGFLRSIYEETKLPYESNLNLEIEAFHVTDVQLAYYSKNEYLEYIQPFYVFKGAAPIVGSDRDAFFSIYYPAIKGKE